MKKTMILIMVFILIPLSIADTEMNLTLITDDDINSTIALIAEGDINNNLYCDGLSCTTNVFGGDIIVSENQTFDIYDFTSYTTTINEKRSAGLSIGKLIGSLAGEMEDYMIDFLSPKEIQKKSDAWNLWAVLDEVFVNHAEFKPTMIKANNLADQIDELKAKNYILYKHMGYNIDPDELECQTALIKAARVGGRITTKNGWIADLEMSTDTCIKLQ